MTNVNTSKKQAKRPKQLYGIAEWYGHLNRSLSNAQRKAFVTAKNTQIPCPFLNQVPALGPKSGKLNCTKRGGICSLRNFHEPTAGGDLTFGPITATCPNRFLEHGIVIKHIAELLLDTDAPLFAKELPFLRRPRSLIAQAAVEETLEDAEGEDAGLLDTGSEDVGRIDLVLVNPEDQDKWCAVEIQAVYFSGAEMAADYPDILAYSGNGVPTPAKVRRPDFRSSGPKRLMPQLMIKVPTLRRWGHKMVVVVDEPFFKAMDPMEEADHVSNCDIVWVIARFDDSLGVAEAPLTIANTAFTTLESAVKGLTAGQPTTLPEFEEKLGSKTASAFPGAGATGSQ
jgi:hypothetical protein